MAGRGPAPKAQRFRRNAPARGEWTPSPEGGWQHPLPEPPKGLLPGTVKVWESWFKAWWAGHWTEDDLPQLMFVIRLHDRVSRGDVRRLGELRQWMDAMGITPKGQQDRRWARPEPPRREPSWRAGADPYAHLRVGDPFSAPSPRQGGAGRPTASQRFRALAEREERRRATATLAVLDGRLVDPDEDEEP